MRQFIFQPPFPDLETSEEDRHRVELWEVPDWKGRHPHQALLPQLPHQGHWGRHQELPLKLAIEWTKEAKSAKNDMEIWNASAEKSIDVTPPTLPQVIQIVPNKTFTLHALQLLLFF